jgi:ABC-type multidrug transport system fused ATPase/permease subunit
MQLSKIFLILPKRRLNQLPFIIVAMVIGAVFEVVGIGLIIPLIAMMSDRDNVINQFLESILPSLSSQNILLLSILIFAVVFTLKGLYLSGLKWFIARYTFAVKTDISNKLMGRYLTAPYEFHLKKNSAQLISNLTTESFQLTQNALMPLLILLSESVVIFAIGIFLILIEPIGTIVVILFLAVFSFIFQRLITGYLSKIGKIRQNADGMVIQKSQEALGGIKDVKALGKEMQFFQQFKMHNIISSEVLAKQYTLGQIPRLYLETVGALIFLILIFLFIIKGKDFLQVIPLLAVFAFAAFRLFPSVNRTISSINSLRFADAVVDGFYDQLTADAMTEPRTPNVKKNTAVFSFDRRIEIHNLSYQYPGSHALALSNINLTIKKGESIGIVGKSGAGKSTLSDIILGLLKPSTGAIYVDGMNIQEDISSWQKLIGYVQQNIYLLDDSLQNNIAFGELDGEIDSKRINNAIIDAQLDEFVSSLPEGIDTRLGERGVRLSGGQKQRIGIARALYRNTPILIFDEATSAIDNKSETEIISTLKRLKSVKTTIIIAHRLSTIEHCDRVINL